MNRLPPRRIGRIVGFGADAQGLNPGDPGYDSTTDPNSPDYVQPVTPSDTGTAPGQGDVPINGSSVPEGQTGQTSTGSGTLNAISSGWNSLQNWFTGGNTNSSSSSSNTNTNITSSNPTGTSNPDLLPSSSSSTTSLANMSVLGVPLWLVAVAIGGVVAVKMFGGGKMYKGGRRRGKKRGARRTSARRRGRRKNPLSNAPYFLEVGRGVDGLWWYTLNVRGRTTVGSDFPTKAAAVAAAKADARGRRRKNPAVYGRGTHRGKQLRRGGKAWASRVKKSTKAKYKKRRHKVMYGSPERIKNAVRRGPVLHGKRAFLLEHGYPQSFVKKASARSIDAAVKDLGRMGTRYHPGSYRLEYYR